MSSKRLLLSTLAIILCAPQTYAGQPLETESARILPAGTFEFEAGLERQTSKLGTETAIPIALEYGISSRFGLLIEPVLFTAIHDNGSPTQSGLGDLEATLTALLLEEREHFPALAFAAEIKIPTAKQLRIGTGRTDYSAFLIATKRTGASNIHLNLGYTLVGQPAGANASNVVSVAIAEELHVTRTFELVGEVFGSTSALQEAADQAAASGENPLTPELGAGEFVGAIGVRFKPGGGPSYSLGVSLDSNNAVLIHPGIGFLW